MGDDDLDEKIRREMERRFMEFAGRVAQAPHPAPPMQLPTIGSGRARMRPGERARDYVERKGAYHQDLADYRGALEELREMSASTLTAGRARSKPRHARRRWDDSSDDPRDWQPGPLRDQVLREGLLDRPPDDPTLAVSPNAWDEPDQLDGEPPSPGEPLTSAVSRLRCTGDPRLLALADALDAHGRDAVSIGEALGCSSRHARRLLAQHAPPARQEIH